MPAVAEAGFRAVAPFTRGYWPTREPKGPYDSDTLGARHPRADRGARRGAGDRRRARLGRERGLRGGRLVARSACACWSRSRSRTRSRSSRRRRRSGRSATSSRSAARRGRRRSRKNDFAYIDELVRAGGRRRGRTSRRRRPRASRRRSRTRLPRGGVRLLRRCRLRRCRKRHRENIKVPTVAFAGEHDIIAPRALREGAPLLRGSLRGRAGARRPLHAPRAPDRVHPELVRTLQEHARA